MRLDRCVCTTGYYIHHQTPNHQTQNRMKSKSRKVKTGTWVVQLECMVSCACRCVKRSTVNENFYASASRTRRTDSLHTDEAEPVDRELESASWYQPGLPREISLEVLSHQEVGSFIIRDSTTHQGCFALSVKVPKYDNPSGISHYLIERTATGFKLKGMEKEWPSLMALVTHHTVMKEMLPCPLKIPRNATNPVYRDRDDEDENYQKISDFTGLMRNMKM